MSAVSEKAFDDSWPFHIVFCGPDRQVNSFSMYLFQKDRIYVLIYFM